MLPLIVSGERVRIRGVVVGVLRKYGLDGWKRIGTVLLAVGIIALVAFTSFVLGDEDFQRAQLVKERNPGNVMYESRYFVALTAHTFLIGGTLCGGLVALNGLTLLLLGIV